ncbi:hypothetical protein [Actinoallomurus sp. NPDC050550]|uniref:hypothetical protein n=1 Tax=Actinoallomurus sp. NPDC050550 TaxID=3154937 RepID=UPI0033D615B0
MSDGVSALETLPHELRLAVRRAVAAVEEADQPVPVALYRGLAPDLRPYVEAMLAAAGRVLIELREGFISGYDDAVARELTREGIGALEPIDAAVLALVLLHGFVIPKAQGELPRTARAYQARRVSFETLVNSRIRSREQIRLSLQRLRDRGLLQPGDSAPIRPGPQFQRLTPQASNLIEENLILLADPDGALADAIRRRRAQARSQAIEGEKR